MYACGLNIDDNVVYTGIGSDHSRVGDCDDPRGRLAPGAKYVIAAIDEHDYYTRVRLSGRADWFNSVLFEKA